MSERPGEAFHATASFVDALTHAGQAHFVYEHKLSEVEQSSKQ
jgi:hypothetical protein